MLKVLRADWLNHERAVGYSKIALVAFVILAVVMMLDAHGVFRPGPFQGIDFLNVYAAGLMVHDGKIAAVYDWPSHYAYEQAVMPIEGYYGWHYPPMFLAVAWILAFLPYFGAFAVYNISTGAAYLAVVKRVAPQVPGTIWMAAAFPGAYVNFANGQNGFITAALLGAGLLLLERRPWLAGVLLGLLAYKPQFALLLPLALLAGRHGRAFLSATVTVVVTVALSALVFGLDAWRAFFASLEPTRTIVIEAGGTGWFKIQTVFSMMRFYGADVQTAYIGQGIAIGLAALAVIVAWVRPAPLAVKAAVLCFAIPLTTPYLLDYDLVILAIPIAFMAKAAAEGGYNPGEKYVLLLAAIAPFAARNAATELGIAIVPPILLLCVGFALWRAFSNASPEHRVADDQRLTQDMLPPLSAR